MPNSVADIPAAVEARRFAARSPSRSARWEAMARFLDAHGWNGIDPAPLAGDASFRTYYRLRRAGESVVAMDAPPPQEDVGPYVTVAEILRGLGLSAPEVIAEDARQGFLLIEDFGDDTYTRLLQRGADEAALYGLAIDVLVELHRTASAAGLPDLPAYDDARLLAEAALLVDWYLPAVLGAPVSIALRDEYMALWHQILAAARRVFAPTLVLRDFHVDNLMLLSGRPAVRACGILDFQDAVLGSPAYDLVSLLEDARRDVPEALRRAMTERYLAALAAFDPGEFRRVAAVFAAQRNCKIIGIFTRLSRRDGKPGYLCHIPRLWRLLEADLRNPALSEIARWLDRHLPPAARRIPDPQHAA